MTIDQFRIGCRFYLGDSKWQCTDVGTRTIAAIEINENAINDPSWLTGPPYGLLEEVIDELDMVACSVTPE